MENMADKISELLSDPNGMERIKQMASALFSDGDKTKEAPVLNTSLPNDGDGVLDGLLSSLKSTNTTLPEGFDPMKLMGLMSVLGRQGDDKRAGLLLALKPHLSSERQERVDKAIKFLKLASILPVLREQGLLDIL